MNTTDAFQKVPSAVVMADSQFAVLIEHRSGRLPIRESEQYPEYGMQVAEAPPVSWVSADGLTERADLSCLDEGQLKLFSEQWRTDGVLLFQVGSFSMQTPVDDPVGLFMSTPGGGL